MKRTLVALLGLVGVVLFGCLAAIASSGGPATGQTYEASAASPPHPATLFHPPSPAAPDLFAQARPAGSGIQVVAGTYGANCRAPHGNKTEHLANACNGRTSCTYTVDYQVIGDPAVGCAKDYTAEWRCGASPDVRRATASPEAGFRKTVELSCAGVASPPVSTGANLALRKPATQSSTGYGGDPGRAVDGNTDGSYFGANSVSHTNNQPQEWWQVDLGAVHPIQVIRIWNRTDCCAERLSRFHVFVSPTPLPAGGVQAAQQHPGVWTYYFDRTAGRTTEIPVSRSGRYVRIQLAGADYLQLAEVEILGGGAVGEQPPAPPGGPVTGRVNLVTVTSSQDYVGANEALQRSGRNDVQFRLAVSAAGRTLTGLELRNTDGQYSVWDTLPGNGMWLMAVTQGGRLLNDAQGRLVPTPLPPSGEATLDLYVEDNGSVAGGQTHYQLTLLFQDGSRQVLPVSLAGAAPPPPTPTSGGITWDFETGDLRGWTKTGTAFDFQPTYGDNPTGRQRGQPSQHQGQYWIGGYEKRPRPSDPAGQVQGDEPQGTLTSAPFAISRPSIGFLLGGGCDINTERVELLVDGQTVLRATGKCTETMERVRWDVSRHVGRTGQLRLVDTSGGGWGHINFDDVRFE